MTNEDFIIKSRSVHNNIYDYSKVAIKTMKAKVCIICEQHGEFLQSPEVHLKGHGCPKCGGSKKLLQQEFLDKIHYVEYYDYSKVIYVNYKTKVNISCTKHNITFQQFPKSVIDGKLGCPICNNSKIDIQQRTKELYGDRYKCVSQYIDDKTPLTIVCKIHGEFQKSPNKFWQGYGCPRCSKKSIGELLISEWLNSHYIEYEYQKKFPDLRDKQLLSYDFYIPSKNLLIEYNGIQHYKNSWDKDIAEFELQQKHDKLKQEYANNKGFNLLVIPYWKFKQINKILNDYFG